MKSLDTQRLLLRPWRLEDLDDFHELMHNPSCIAGGWKPSACREASLDILKSYIEVDGIFAIFLKKSGKAIGFIKIYPDNNRGKYYAKMINYLLNENYWNNGYMTEAVKCIVQYAFENLNVGLLSAFTTPQNIGSKKVLEKSRFIYEGTIKNVIKDVMAKYLILLFTQYQIRLSQKIVLPLGEGSTPSATMAKTSFSCGFHVPPQAAYRLRRLFYLQKSPARTLRCVSSSEKGHAAPLLFACKCARHASSCYQPLSRYESSNYPAKNGKRFFFSLPVQNIVFVVKLCSICVAIFYRSLNICLI